MIKEEYVIDDKAIEIIKKLIPIYKETQRKLKYFNEFLGEDIKQDCKVQDFGDICNIEIGLCSVRRVSEEVFKTATKALSKLIELETHFNNSKK